jgi:PAS domain S-box-containing protein
MEAVVRSASTHSLPLFARDAKFDGGQDFSWCSSTTFDLSAGQDALASQGIGTWECDLSKNVLTWSTGVFDLFGMARDKTPTRKKTVVLYRENSRVKMERLRANAIEHGRGFTLDAEIVPANGGHRWIRLIATPVFEGPTLVRLQGFKRDVTQEYR